MKEDQPRWQRSDQALPCNVNMGDRYVIIVAEREHAKAPIEPKVVVLAASQDGWYAMDEQYQGYSIEDGVVWINDKDLGQIAKVLWPEIMWGLTYQQELERMKEGGKQ